MRLFLHGLGQTPSDWDGVLAGMAPGEDVLRPDLRQLLGGRDAEFPALFRGFEEYCGRLEGPLCLCGLSLGGVLALRYAMEHPARVSSMVLVGTQYAMPSGLLRFQNAVFHLMPDRAFPRDGFGKQGFIALSRSMMYLDLEPRLREVRCPVLVVCGERDRANRSAALQLSGKLPHAEIAFVPKAGHEVNTEAPKALAGLLTGFWGGPGASAGL